MTRDTRENKRRQIIISRLRGKLFKASERTRRELLKYIDKRPANMNNLKYNSIYIVQTDRWAR